VLQLLILFYITLYLVIYMYFWSRRVAMCCHTCITELRLSDISLCCYAVSVVFYCSVV